VIKGAMIDRRLFLATATAALAAGPTVHAQTGSAAAWPNRPLRFVVGFSAGSTPDLIARTIGEPLTKLTGQPVVVEDKPGASGNIAADIVAKAKDDHTVGVMINLNLTIARLLLALPAPHGAHPDHPALRLAATVLGGGRTSRLQHTLVEEEQLCVWVSADLSEGMDASMLTVTAEVVPGVDPARVEARVFELLAELRTNPPGAEEIERCRQIAVADWVFGHEKVHQQALSVGLALALFDLEYLDLHLDRLLATGPERLLEVAERYLRPERGSVVGWSLPKS